MLMDHLEQAKRYEEAALKKRKDTGRGQDSSDGTRVSMHVGSSLARMLTSWHPSWQHFSCRTGIRSGGSSSSSSSAGHGSCAKGMQCIAVECAYGC